MLSVIFRWKCDECEATHVESQGDFTDVGEAIGTPFGIGSQVLLYHLPCGWSFINGKMICPLHKISIASLAAGGDDGT